MLHMIISFPWIKSYVGTLFVSSVPGFGWSYDLGFFEVEFVESSNGRFRSLIMGVWCDGIWRAWSWGRCSQTKVDHTKVCGTNDYGFRPTLQSERKGQWFTVHRGANFSTSLAKPETDLTTEMLVSWVIRYSGSIQSHSVVQWGLEICCFQEIQFWSEWCSYKWWRITSSTESPRRVQEYFPRNGVCILRLFETRKLVGKKFQHLLFFTGGHCF